MYNKQKIYTCDHIVWASRQWGWMEAKLRDVDDKRIVNIWDEMIRCNSNDYAQQQQQPHIYIASNVQLVYWKLVGFRTIRISFDSVVFEFFLFNL